MVTQISIESGGDGTGRSLVSVVFGQRFAIEHGGRLVDREDFEFCVEPEEYEDIPSFGPINPSLLKRDIDSWPWKAGTDVVVQGTARYSSPVSSAEIVLDIQGPASLRQVICATGDRRVERSGSALCLSAPNPFESMPLRWDKAYGGTDAEAHEKMLHPDYVWFLEQQMSKEEAAGWSELSYPRNPAGKGYLIEGSNPEGLAWPNLEFVDERLRLERLQLPLEQWGAQVYPACWDWLPYMWVPRLCGLGDHAETSDGRAPSREVELGLLPADFPSIPMTERNPSILGRGAHPYLQRLRLVGNESLAVSAIGPEGRDLKLQLPGFTPSVQLRLEGGEVQELEGELDLVFVEGEEETVTLVWRATTFDLPNPLGVDFSEVGEIPLPMGWQERADIEIDWQRLSPT